MTRQLLSICLVVVLMACFSSVPRERIVGNYCLEKWPTSFAVVGCSAAAKLQGRTDNGPMEGGVLRLGWDDRFIVAERVAMFGGNVAWMILDTKTETLEGPLTNEELAAKRRASAALGRIEVSDAAKAWDALH